MREEAMAVTGAARGTGRAIAVHAGLPELRDRDDEVLARTVAEPENRGMSVRRRVVNVRDEPAVAANAGVGMQEPFPVQRLEAFGRLFEVDPFGVFGTLREIARRLVDAGLDGRLVTVAPVAGLPGSCGRAAYAASKAAVIHLTQVAAVELAPHGIAVNAVAPGPVETPLVAAMDTPATRAAWLRHVPARRCGRPEEVAWPITGAPTYVTGQVLCVDGGFHAAGLRFDVRGEEGGTLDERP